MAINGCQTYLIRLPEVRGGFFMTQTLEDKLQELRTEWKKYPQRRKIIETQVKILKMSEHPKVVNNEFSKLVYKSLS